MTTDIFPKGIDPSNKQKLLDLAQKVFDKSVDTLTKEDLKMLLTMDMSLSFNKITVSAAQTRPTSKKYATNNYHASLDISLDKVMPIVLEKMDTVPEAQLIDKYLELKSVVYNMIRLKYESTERYLRSLLDSAAKKDGCVDGRDDE